MNLNDLGIVTKPVLQNMGMRKRANRNEIAQSLGLTPVQVGKSLQRLEAMGLVDPPETPKAPWTITAKGLELLGYPSIPQAPENTVTYPLSAILDSPEEEATEAEELPNQHGRSENDEELQQELEKIQVRLRPGILPDSAYWTFITILDQLPAVVRQALAPIMALVEAHR